MSLRIIQAGILSLMVDLGREGYQHLGVTGGGPMDEHAYLWAQRLLDNRPNTPSLEITYGLFQAQFQAPTTIAVTGADLQMRLNEQALLPWQTYAVQEGDILSCKTPHNGVGLRAYLSVPDGFQVPSYLGSVTTTVREGLGGVHGDGKALQVADEIGYQPSKPRLVQRQVPDVFMPDYAEPLSVALLAGYQFERFAAPERARFLAQQYRITQRIDRMGYRLQGEPIVWEGSGMVSEGISYGAVQIASDGQPIVLLRDRQTMGGYPKMGCVSYLDAGRLAQRGVNATVQFKLAERGQVLEEYAQYRQFFRL